VTTPDESEGENGLQEDIFQIPMRFKIEGQKSDVVDFIHFFENVGSIELQDKKMEIYSDRFISKVIQGDKSSTSYNIYKHQIADIVSLEWKDYPDSSTHSNGETLLSLMKGSQAREKVSVELDLNFYVSGVPGYRMEKYVQELLEDFDTLAQDLDLQSKKYTLQAYKFTKGEELQAISQLQNLSSIFTTEQENIQKLRVSLLKRENIQDTYELAIKYRSVLDWIEENYKKQIDILTVNAK
jgi:hypothetical protein